MLIENLVTPIAYSSAQLIDCELEYHLVRIQDLYRLVSKTEHVGDCRERVALKGAQPFRIYKCWFWIMNAMIIDAA